MHLVKTAGDAIVGVDDAGTVFRYNQRSARIKRTSRLNYISDTHHYLSSAVRYYCPHSQQFRNYGMDQNARPVYDIHAFVPKAMISLITATTPFYIYNEVLYVYMRSFVWVFAKCRLIRKTPILRESTGFVFDYDAPLSIDINPWRLQISQGNTICVYEGSTDRYLKASIIKLPARFQVLYHYELDKYIAFDTVTQATILVEYCRANLIDSGHEHYIRTGSGLYAVSNGRLIVLDKHIYLSIKRSDLKPQVLTMTALGF